MSPPATTAVASRGSAAPAGTQALAPAATTPLLSSSELLRGQASVVIAHNGQHYRLQATRQGKLILTK